MSVIVKSSFFQLPQSHMRFCHFSHRLFSPAPQCADHAAFSLHTAACLSASESRVPLPPMINSCPAWRHHDFFHFQQTRPSCAGAGL